MGDRELKKLEKKIHYKFKNKDLLKNSLTHKTYAFEAKTPVEFNERLEFLGDSILGFVVAEQLYHSNKYFSEGELTRRRSVLVNNTFLAEKAKELGLGNFLFFGVGETKQNGDKNPTNLANALEALIGAVYLDSDLDTVCDFIRKNIFDNKLQL
jgi:ribonuclease-3